MTALTDTATLTRRSLTHIARSPDTIITTAVTPIAILLLLFVFVFGGAIDIGQGAGNGSYVTYLLPGVLLITIASGVAYTAYRLFGDLQSGIFERFQAMPIARSATLWAHVVTSVVANLTSVAVVVGVACCSASDPAPGCSSGSRSPASSRCSRSRFTWLAVIPGLTAKSVEGASAFSYPLIFLPFLSSAFVPTDSMPGRCGGLPRTSP